MKNLTLLEQEALGILKQLERCCEVIELHNPEYVSEKKFLEVNFGDLDFSVLKKGENIHDIEKYLQKNGVNFSITFDLINEFPDMYIDREHPDESFIELGVIRGENIQDIKEKIKGLIYKINYTTRNAKEEESKKYYDANEDIFLKTLKLKIKGNYILRGEKMEEINPTDKALIYFLYFKSIKNADECFSIKDLSVAEEIKQSERYIKNRITVINQSIKRMLYPNLKLKIGRFIKNERGRGYHLNPKILLIKPKK